MQNKFFHKGLRSGDCDVQQKHRGNHLSTFCEEAALDKFDFPTSSDEEVRLQALFQKDSLSVKCCLNNFYLETLNRRIARHRTTGNVFGYAIRTPDGITGAVVCCGMARGHNDLIEDKRLKDFTPQTHIRGKVNRAGIKKMPPPKRARSQGASDSYLFYPSGGHIHKQFGGSVTVHVICAVAEEIRKALQIS